jgi:hypothetical protein
MLNHGMFGTECMFKEKHMIGLEICKQGTEVKLILASIDIYIYTVKYSGSIASALFSTYVGHYFLIYVSNHKINMYLHQ